MFFLKIQKFMSDIRIGQNCDLEFLPKGRPSILKLNLSILNNV